MIAFEIAGLPLYMVAVCTLLALIGSSVQGSLGFGLGMLTSPIFAMIDHSFVPVAMMLAVMPLTFGVAFRDRKFIDASGFKCNHSDECWLRKWLYGHGHIDWRTTHGTRLQRR